MPTAESDGCQPPASGLFRWTGAVCVILGVLLALAWCFRAYILFLVAPGDRLIFLHGVVTAISLGLAVMLIVVGARTLRGRNRSHDAWWLAVAGGWISAVGLNRLAAVLLHPAADPNPRAHLHLAVSFIVMGVILLLLGGGALWRRHHHAPGDHVPPPQIS